ncbi:major facilitator superfamily domain-containing protein [Naematelia encephala]|uniref:Major facilitator superfamily domain-containing protein n=1 Tax=Naematelia encephala TaxID=71784 RepID=A0A1Y2BG63_9TREE|nr:major facilitator superfamily domain-containing protein [Naematelia encephala]
MSGELDEKYELGSEPKPLDTPPVPTILRQPSHSRSTRNHHPPSSSQQTSTSFAPLSHTPSRASSRSANRTYVDSATLFTALPEITRAETRASRVGKGYTVGVIHEHHGRESEELEGDEKTVAVQITPDGEEFTFPDGGKEAWLCVLGGAGALFCGFGLAASAGAFQTYYSENQLASYASSQIAWIGSVQAFVTFSISPFTGSLFDLYGHRPLIAAGTFLLVLGFCMLSLCSKYWQLFICHATLIPLGMDLMFISPVGVVSQWFALKRGMAFGIMMTGSSLGATIWPIIWANAPQRIGFGWTMRLIALMCALLGLTGFFLLRTRLPPKPPGPFLYLEAFKSVSYCCVAFASFTWVFGFFSWLFFCGTYGRLVGLDHLAPYFIVILNASSCGGRLFTSLIADKIGAFNVTIISNCVMIVCYFSWLACKTAPSLIVLNVLFGFLSGTFVSLQAVLAVKGAVDMRFAGTMVGQVLLCQSLAQLLGPPIAGILLGHGTNQEQLSRFPHAIVLGSMMLLAGNLSLILARWWIDKKWKAVV